MKRIYPRQSASFTLIELLTVIAIIAILAALTVAAFSGVMKSAGRNRARAEIQAMTAALESYKSDNGVYPASGGGFTSTNDYLNDAAPAPGYQTASEALYQNLTGQTNSGDPPPSSTSGVKIYMTFKSSQLGTAGTTVYLKDPFGNPYGYFTGNPTDPVNGLPANGTNEFDLWSTGGDVSGTAAGKSTWISNWGSGS